MIHHHNHQQILPNYCGNDHDNCDWDHDQDDHDFDEYDHDQVMIITFHQVNVGFGLPPIASQTNSLDLQYII